MFLWHLVHTLSFLMLSYLEMFKPYVLQLVLCEVVPCSLLQVNKREATTFHIEGVIQVSVEVEQNSPLAD